MKFLLSIILIINFNLFAFDIAKYDTYEGTCPDATTKNYFSTVNLSISCNDRDYPYCPNSSFTKTGLYTDTGTYFEAFCSLKSSDDFATDYKSNSYDCTEYRYECVSNFCDDGAPVQNITSSDDNNNTIYYANCDRSCEDVNYVVGGNGQCIDPTICDTKANQCSDSCNGFVESFSCADGVVTGDCICQDKCQDYSNQCIEQCNSQNMTVANFACSNNNIDTPCQCVAPDNPDNPDTSNNTDTTSDNNTSDNTIDDTTNTDTTTDNNNIDDTTDTTQTNDTSDNTDTTNNTTYTNAPASGSGTGGNSLTDNMQNLGSNLNSNTDAINNNTQALNDNTSILTKISDFLSTLTDIIDNPSQIADNITTYLQDSTIKYNQNFFNENCSEIQTISINLYGQNIVFLSQSFIDNYFPINILKPFIIFMFAFAGVVTFFRSSN